jgi:hypothetical protein
MSFIEIIKAKDDFDCLLPNFLYDRNCLKQIPENQLSESIQRPGQRFESFVIILILLNLQGQSNLGPLYP